MGTGARQRAVFLDRDGVLNEPIVRDGRPLAPTDPADLVISPGAPAACRLLRADGFMLIVVTNQPELARRTMERRTVETLHARLESQLPLDAIYVCPHDDDDHCLCRKPAPGLLLAAAVDYNIELKRSFLVGDRWRDVEAGQQVGCRTLFVNRHYQERPALGADAEVSNLSEAARWIHARREVPIG